MLKILDSILKKLPLDGSKTELGALLLLLPTAIPEIVPVATNAWAAVATAIVAIGALHKAVKKVVKQVSR